MDTSIKPPQPPHESFSFALTAIRWQLNLTNIVLPCLEKGDDRLESEIESDH